MQLFQKNCHALHHLWNDCSVVCKKVTDGWSVLCQGICPYSGWVQLFPVKMGGGRKSTNWTLVYTYSYAFCTPLTGLLLLYKYWNTAHSYALYFSVCTDIRAAVALLTHCVIGIKGDMLMGWSISELFYTLYTLWSHSTKQLSMLLCGATQLNN